MFENHHTSKKKHQQIPLAVGYTHLFVFYDRLLDSLTYLEFSSVPRFHYVTSTSSFEPLTLKTTSLLSNNLSKGTNPLGI